MPNEIGSSPSCNLRSLTLAFSSHSLPLLFLRLLLFFVSTAFLPYQPIHLHFSQTLINQYQMITYTNISPIWWPYVESRDTGEWPSDRKELEQLNFLFHTFLLFLLLLATGWARFAFIAADISCCCASVTIFLLCKKQSFSLTQQIYLFTYLCFVFFQCPVRHWEQNYAWCNG